MYLYKSETWWDKAFYGEEIADSKTISKRTGQIATLYHYASVELLILRHFSRYAIEPPDCAFDVGSGASHWIRFYKKLGASKCVGVDVSAKCVELLSNQYAEDDSVSIYHGVCENILSEVRGKYDIVNAIGVMFHIVDDEEWSRNICKVSDSLQEGAIL